MIPDRYSTIVEAIKKLEVHDRYISAFIFGSIARGDSTPASDFDVWVITDEDNTCQNINHPFIDNIKLDITFLSFNQLKKRTKSDQVSGQRIPMIAESIIIFDKTGEISELRTSLLNIKPNIYDKEKDFQKTQFIIYYLDTKVRTSKDNDSATAFLCMHAGISELLKIHYKLQQRWYLSDKKLLTDLEKWDKKLLVILNMFLSESNLENKFAFWSEIIDHVLIPLGGRQNIKDNNCDCPVCEKDLSRLMNKLK